MTQESNQGKWYRGEDKFSKGLRFVGDEGIDMEKRLDDILADIIHKITKYMNADTSYLNELKAEEAEWVVQSDGKHLYVGKKTIKDPEQLSVLEAGIYTARIEAIKFGADVHLFSTGDAEDEAAKKLKAYFGNKGLNPKSALQYMNAYLKLGIGEDEVVQKVLDSADEIEKNPGRYAPQPERATEYLAACVETLRQIIENHRFTRDQFEIVYKPLERLAGPLTLFPPKFSEEEEELMREDRMDEREIDAMLKGAQQCHQYYCQVLDVYKEIAREILEGE